MSNNTDDITVVNGDSPGTTLVPVSALSSSPLPSPTDEEGQRERADALGQVAARVAEAITVARGNSVTPRVYLVKGHQLERDEEGVATTQEIGGGATVAAYVAKTGETVHASGGNTDQRYPDGIGQAQVRNDLGFCCQLKNYLIGP